MKILITGSAGFIGYHLHCFLHQKKFKVLGCDNLTSVSKKTQKTQRWKAMKNCRWKSDEKIILFGK